MFQLEKKVGNNFRKRTKLTPSEKHWNLTLNQEDQHFNTKL